MIPMYVETFCRLNTLCMSHSFCNDKGCICWLCMQVRSMQDSLGSVTAASPSFAVQMVGLNALPVAGDDFAVCASDSEVRLPAPGLMCMSAFTGGKRICLRLPRLLAPVHWTQ